MPEFGTYYVNESIGFPAVVIKGIGDDSVLVRVWTDQADLTIIAARALDPSQGVFVAG